MNRRDLGAEPADLRCKRANGSSPFQPRGNAPGYSVPKKSAKGQGPAPSLMSQSAVPQSRRHPCHFQQQGSLSVFGCVSSTRASCLSCHRRPKCRLRLPPCRMSRGSRASRHPVVAHDYHRPIGGDLENVVVEMGEDADKGTRRLFVAARLWLFFGGTFGPRGALSIHRPARGTSSDAVVSGGVPGVFGEIRRRL